MPVSFQILKSPLGDLMAISDGVAVCLLEFTDNPRLDQKLKKLQRTKGFAHEASCPVLRDLEKELAEYFAGGRTAFSISYQWRGTAFQKDVWEQLILIPYGHTRSYADQARGMGAPQAYRAVANANGANSLVIVVPCHRIIANDGGLGGYGGGVHRKQWLLNHERKGLAHA
jgi:AraC family transcriptional regulator of adaptative response/methylated-DNA-[protein]-cysteine methyltransferase